MRGTHQTIGNKCWRRSARSLDDGYQHLWDRKHQQDLENSKTLCVNFSWAYARPLFGNINFNDFEACITTEVPTWRVNVRQHRILAWTCQSNQLIDLTSMMAVFSFAYQSSKYKELLAWLQVDHQITIHRSGREMPILMSTWCENSGFLKAGLQTLEIVCNLDK